MEKRKINAIKTTLLFVLAICCIVCFSACSSPDKYGNEETYYDLNSGNTVYFDGNGNCNFCGADCTYEIKNGNYYIYGDNTLNFKKVKDGVLVDTFKESSSFLNVSVRSGYISGSIMIDNSITYLYDDGSYRIGVNNSIITIGKYYYNDGVLVLEQTGGMTNSGIWVDGIAYSVVYVNEQTGKLSGVLLANPSYYKQWHFNGNNENNNNSYLRHTLTYDLNYDGLTITAQPIAKGENINLIVPERAGYKFTGWYYNYRKVESGIWQHDENVTLTASWEAVNYSITYNTDSGIMPEYYLKSFSVSSYELPYTLPIPIKQGLNFVGWYENADFSGEQITTIPQNSLQNYVLYAQYTDEQLVELELSFDETYYSVIGYKGKPQYITIPKTKDGLPVKEIAVKALENCTTLINIALPDSITSIGSSAFSYCRSLTNITIPDSVTNIGSYAFRECSSLTSITIPDGVTSIESEAFSYCRSLTSITIPDSVTNIGSYAFRECSSLTSIIIPDGVTTIGYHTFYGCSSLTSITIPDSVTSIESEAFSGCSSLTSITIPDSVTSIESEAFSGCSSLTSITIPDGVTSVGSSAFPTHLCKRYSGCFYLPTKNSDYGFLYRCISNSDVGNVKIHDECKMINILAFRYCDSLTSIIIPKGVTSIDSGAFYQCSNLTSITIPDSVTSIGYEAFSSCSSLTSITIPDSVTSIGNYAFRGCSSLTSITIPDSVTSIGNSAFYDCDSLTSIIIPKGVTTIGGQAFYDCDSLKSIFYKGNAENWSNITIGSSAISSNKYLYYYSATEPTGDGNYWHYDTDGKTPVIWQKEN